MKNIMDTTTNLAGKSSSRKFSSGEPIRANGRPQTPGAVIQMAVDAIDNAVLKPLNPEATSPVTQARAVLALLVNCYAHQIYSSRNAATLAARDPDFLWFWWETFPDARALRRFREENFAAIHGCLTLSLQLLAEQKNFAGGLTKIKGSQFAEEASRRISMAAFVDSMELDRARGE